jgi:lipopolysaccharide transport system permease protein
MGSATVARGVPGSVSVRNATGEGTVRIQPSKGSLSLGLGDVWRYRELLYFLVWRDVKVRYKQTLMGAVWVMLQPILTMLVFTVVFGQLAKMPSDGVPYSLFIFAALLPWSYFSQAIGRCGASLVSDSNLVKKVYFPRLIIPLAAVGGPLVDFLVSLGALFGMLAWHGKPLRWSALTLPLFLLVAVGLALGVGLWLSSLNARYRDIGHTIPFLTQFWFFASPIAYPLSLFPERWRPLYALNPMVGVIEGFRWALLGKESPSASVMGLSVLMVGVLLWTGALFFRRMERIVVDVL